MSYNCFIKSRSAFLLLFGGEMTSGFGADPPPPLVTAQEEEEEEEGIKIWLHHCAEMEPVKVT